MQDMKQDEAAIFVCEIIREVKAFIEEKKWASAYKACVHAADTVNKTGATKALRQFFSRPGGGFTHMGAGADVWKLRAPIESAQRELCRLEASLPVDNTGGLLPDGEGSVRE